MNVSSYAKFWTLVLGAFAQYVPASGFFGEAEGTLLVGLIVACQVWVTPNEPAVPKVQQ